MKLLAFLNRESLEREMDEELRFHLEARTEDLMRRGLSQAEAQSQARQEFGGIAVAKEDCRRSLGLRLAGDFSQDFRYALRSFRRNLAFTTVALLTLALGIAANTAIFSVVNGVMLRSLPYRDAGQLAMLWRSNPKSGSSELSVSPLNFEDWRRQSGTFEDMAFYTVSNLPIALVDRGAAAEEPEMVWHSAVSANFFQLLGTMPVLGRTFSSSDAERRTRLVVLSQRLWSRQFGANGSIIGRTVTVGGLDYQVAGVMPTEFEFPTRKIEIWTSLEADPNWGAALGRRDNASLIAFGRLRGNVSVAGASAEMSGILSRLASQYPETNAGDGIHIVPLQVQVLGKSLPFLLYVLLGAVACVLCIACTNIASLLLARGAAREREMAVRAAMGAGRLRLVRQMLTESSLLGLAGGLVSLPLALWGLDALKALAGSSIPRIDQVGLDGRVLAFTFALSLMAGMLCGLLPSLKVSRFGPGMSMARALRSGRFQGTLVVAQFALAVVLLTGGGLLIRSFLAVLAVDPGINPHGILTVELRLRNRTPENFQAIYEGVSRLPGVQAVGTINDVLLIDNVKFREDEAGPCTIEVEGTPSFRGEVCGPMYMLPNSGEALQALGVRLRKGRWFTSADGPQATPVVLINEAMARRFWRDREPVGARFRGCPTCRWLTVVGVLADIHQVGLERGAALQVFAAPLQTKPGGTLVVRTAGDPLRVAAAVRKTIRSVDPQASIWQLDSLERRLDQQVAARRLQAWLLGLLSGFALLLAAIGIYGVMHYSVVQRSREIGIRLALGARRRNVLGMVIRQGLTLAIAGVVLGMACAWSTMQSISALLFGVRPNDAGMLAGVAVILVLVAVLACYVPAQRATRVDPMTALRCE